MSIKNGFLALVLTFFCLPALALESCHLSGTINLDKDTSIYCTGGKDLVIEKGAEINTHGFELTFHSDRKIIDNGLKINVVKGDNPSFPNGKDAGSIVFEAEEIVGACEYIHNNGYKNGAGGAVVYKVIGLAKYKCRDLTFTGIGQGRNGDVVAFNQDGSIIPFTEFKAHVMN